MQKAIFQNHEKAIAAILYRSQHKIDIGVCWFSHPLFFSILLEKARLGVKIQLVLQFDQANFHPKGLPFKQLVEAGGKVYAYRQKKLLHHKFMLVDGKYLLTGSYNWTGTTNADNLIFTDSSDLVMSYQREFNRLWEEGESLKRLVKVIPPAPSFIKLFEPVAWDVSDLRHAIIWGARVWVAVFNESEMEVWKQCLQMQRHFLKSTVDYFNQNNFVWDPENFSEWSEGLSLAKRRLLNNYCKKLRIRDVIVTVSNKGVFLAAGLVGSIPEPGHLENYAFARFVQWFEFPEKVHPMEKVPVSIFTKYRESGLALVNSLTDRRVA